MYNLNVPSYSLIINNAGDVAMHSENTNASEWEGLTAGSRFLPRSVHKASKTCPFTGLVV